MSPEHLLQNQQLLAHRSRYRHAVRLLSDTLKYPQNSDRFHNTSPTLLEVELIKTVNVLERARKILSWRL